MLRLYKISFLIFLYMRVVMSSNKLSINCTNGAIRSNVRPENIKNRALYLFLFFWN
uniref:Uncharacterized protein n=1 Tax=Rhizophora mucronata TaxID=61149 RepID=A0A2P2QUV8_RHIMU